MWSALPLGKSLVKRNLARGTFCVNSRNLTSSGKSWGARVHSRRSASQLGPTSRNKEDWAWEVGLSEGLQSCLF